MEGIKEVKEAVVALNELTIFVAGRVKDGVGVDDAMALVSKLMTDEAFKAKIAAALESAEKIPAELKDISLQEGIELAGLQMGYLPQLVEAFKKPAA